MNGPSQSARVGACCRPNALQLKPHCLIVVHGGGNWLRLGRCTLGVNTSLFSQRVFVTWCVAPASVKRSQEKSEQLPAIHRNPKWTTGEWFLKHSVIRYVLIIDSALLCCVKWPSLCLCMEFRHRHLCFCRDRLELVQRRQGCGLQ